MCGVLCPGDEMCNDAVAAKLTKLERGLMEAHLGQGVRRDDFLESFDDEETP